MNYIARLTFEVDTEHRFSGQPFPVQNYQILKSKDFRSIPFSTNIDCAGRLKLQQVQKSPFLRQFRFLSLIGYTLLCLGTSLFICQSRIIIQFAYWSWSICLERRTSFLENNDKPHLRSRISHNVNLPLPSDSWIPKCCLTEDAFPSHCLVHRISIYL